MTVLEFGKEKPRVLILLHGGGLSWWNYRKAAEELSELFHVVLPVLDGHAGSDASFTSIEDNAARIIRYIDEHFGGEVTAIAGLSLGGNSFPEGRSLPFCPDRKCAGQALPTDPRPHRSQFFPELRSN